MNQSLVKQWGEIKGLIRDLLPFELNKHEYNTYRDLDPGYQIPSLKAQLLMLL